MIIDILLLLTVASWIYWLVALYLVHIFFRSKKSWITAIVHLFQFLSR